MKNFIEIKKAELENEKGGYQAIEIGQVDVGQVVICGTVDLDVRKKTPRKNKKEF